LYRYDTDGDGKLSADELPPRAQRLIEQADADQDGSVDRKELETFLLNR
jgi:Ca2+-binding EF-hand superfamily protein